MTFISASIRALSLSLIFTLGCAGGQSQIETAPQGIAAARSDQSPYGDYVESLLAAPEPKLDSPGSLWNERSYEQFLGYDRRAAGVGDLVTVLIIEDTQARRQATTNLSRDSDQSANVSAMMGLDDKLSAIAPNINPEAGIGAGASSAYSGEGTTERRGSLKATVTARVVGELKDGNLIIVGRQEVKVNQEVQILTIRGIVRPQDITIDNTIPSTHVADAMIEYAGAGVIAEKQTPPWGSRVVDRVLPF